jgi:hypothetical protein
MRAGAASAYLLNGAQEDLIQEVDIAVAECTLDDRGQAQA